MIFYFTATGNSKHIAELIAAATEDQIMNISDCMQKERFSFALGRGERLGFVVPVYFMGIPRMVIEFLKKLNVSAGQEAYSYLVLNCGGTSADAEGMFNRAYPVNAVFGIATVDNYVPMYQIGSESSIEACLDKAEQEVDAAIVHIRQKDVGTFNPYRKHLPRLVSAVGTSVFKRGRKTAEFTVNQNCTGCRLCEKICPRKAIELKDGQPSWIRPQCELCFGCLHRCPAAAINYGKKTAGNGRYINPRTRL